MSPQKVTAPFGILSRVTQSSTSSHLRRWQHSSAKDDIPSTSPEWPTKINPSPYDIFAISRSAPYTKKRFYQLVKLYHPDLSTHTNTVTPTVRLERYRLIIAANDLLSDPSKRKLYDTHGMGWQTNTPPNLRDVDKAWRAQPNSPAMNATWEDWERWYDNKDGKRREPMYMPNGVFATLVAMFCVVGAMAQAERAESTGQQYVDWRAAANHAVGEDVRQSTMASAGMSKDQRVDRFLRDRENVAFHYTPSTTYDASAAAGEEPSEQAKQARIIK